LCSIVCLPTSFILRNDSERFREEEIIEDGSRVHQFYLKDSNGNHHIAAKGRRESDSDHFTYSAHPQLTELKTLWSCSSVVAVRSWLSSIIELSSCRSSQPPLFGSPQVQHEGTGQTHPELSTALDMTTSAAGQPHLASATRPISSLHDHHNAPILGVSCDSEPVPASPSVQRAHHLHAAHRKRKASEDPVPEQPLLDHDPGQARAAPTRSFTAGTEIFDRERSSDRTQSLPRTRSL
jgi:hypothetical protein